MPEPEELMEEKALPFTEHLEELRGRLIKSMIAVFIAFLGSYFFSEQLYGWLMEPLINAIPEGEEQAIYFKDPVEPFFAYLKVALIAGIFISIPVILWHGWHFVAPGLYPSERKAAIPFVIFSTIFFVGGGLFCRYLVLPFGLKVLMGVGSDAPFKVQAQIMMKEYLSLATKMLLAFGLVFEMPVAVSFFAALNLITHRTLIKHFRIAIVLSFVIAAILTPPDIFTQMALALPLLTLYGLSIFLAWTITRKREKIEAKEKAENEQKEAEKRKRRAEKKKQKENENLKKLEMEESEEEDSEEPEPTL